MVRFFREQFEYFLPSPSDPFEGDGHKSEYEFFQSKIRFYKRDQF